MGIIKLTGGVMQKVDKEGVLNLVQSIIYCYGNMTLEVTFFDGCVATFGADILIPDLGLTQNRLTPMNYYQAEQFLERYISAYWWQIHNSKNTIK